MTDKTKPIMTLLLRDCAPNHLTRTAEDDMIVVLDSNTQQVLHYKKVTGETAKFPIPLVSRGQRYMIRLVKLMWKFGIFKNNIRKGWLVKIVEFLAIRNVIPFINSFLVLIELDK